MIVSPKLKQSDGLSSVTITNSQKLAINSMKQTIAFF